MILGGALAWGSSDIMARTFGMEYTCEWQTDFDTGCDWLNHLKLTAEVPLYRSLTFEAASISVAKCRRQPLVEDLLTYSNIEAGNIPLTFARLGLSASVKNAEFFAGINNVNEDYFISELTSFFINSSCGISPTISCNYDIANYPVAAWCVHYRQALGDFSLQTSLYPGKGYYRLWGHDHLFSFDLRHDGIFSISAIDYQKNGIYCNLGVALHYGVCIADEDAEQPETPAQAPHKSFSAAPWILSEINLPCKLGILAHASLSTVKDGCKWYAGAGLIYSGWRVQPGIAFNYASFTDANEYALELSTRVPVFSSKAYVQPAVHVVKTSYASARCIGMVRFNLII